MSQAPALPRVDKRVLTDRALKALRPAPAGKRYVVWDGQQPHLGVRVTDRATKDGKAASVSFIVMRRLPGEAQPIRHTIGQYHPEALPLAKARAEARRVLELFTGGTTPKEEVQRLARKLAERRANTVAAVADDYIKDMYARGLRNVREFEAIIRREFLGQALGNDAKWNDQKEPIWRDRPITEITPEDAARRIKAIKDRGGDPEPGHRRRSSGGPWAAHHALSIGKAWFAWAIDQHAYGLTSSPFERLKPKRIIGAKKPRQRTLSEAELRIVWNAAGKMGGAYGDLVRLLALTGQRLSQTAEIQRAEIDLDRGVWLSPPGKMKMNKSHATPLAPATAELLRGLFDKATHRNGFLFTTTAGERPISGFSKFKIALDKAIAELCREAAGSDDAELEQMAHWTLHDLRRTVRTNLPALGVPDVVAEAVLAHARPGIVGVYDLHTYAAEKKQALERWAARLASIVDPAPANVVPSPSGRPLNERRRDRPGDRESVVGRRARSPRGRILK
jgi:integrase